MSKVMRSVKNVTKGYSSVQVKVRDATSNDTWGPTGTQMAEIAQLTYSSHDAFFEIVDMLDKRLNDKGKNWRHVLKALKVLDYTLHEGSENVVMWAQKNVYIIKTLREFQHVDEDGRDVGQNIRVSAKELTSLILDDERLKKERKDRKSWKSRVTGLEYIGGQSMGGSPDPPKKRNERRDRRADEEEAEVRLAIEASKHEAEEEERRRQKNNPNTADDEDLQKALKLSKEEEELRRRELEQSNATSLFDDAPTQTQQPAPTGNNGYTQMQAVDWQGLPIDQQATGYPTNGYPGMPGQMTGMAQHQTGFVSQPTGFQNGYSNGFAQPQQQNSTGFDPQQAFNNAAYTGFPQAQPQQPQPTFDAFSVQQQQQPQPGIFDQQPQQAGTNNPWGSNPQPQLDALKPTPTGSNNPFASSFTRPQPTQPTLSTLAEQKTQTQFNNTSFNPSTSFNPNPNPITAPIPASISPQPVPQESSNPHHARLNALLASGEGQDTFGNVGDLRIPAQHTAPGTFVNSAGQGLDKLHASQTGNNPFFNQQQFTGNPSQNYGLSNAAGLGAPGQNRMIPAQTGPAGVVGFGGNPSPFGPQGGAAAQQQSAYGRQNQGAAGGSLIDL